MSLPHGFSFFSWLTALLLAASSAHGQWLVFDVRFKADQDVSVNFGPYTGAYVIAPIEGGTASMVFVTEDGGRFYSAAENSARYFIATNATKRRAVISAITQNGTAQVMYQASGFLNSTMSYTSGGERRGARIPLDLHGTMLASDDETFVETPGADASIGLVGTASMKGSLRVDLCRILNQSEIKMGEAVMAITSLLEKYGYTSDAEVEAPAIPVQGETTTAEPAPIGEGGQPVPSSGQPDGSLFPPGSKEEMERALKSAKP